MYSAITQAIQVLLFLIWAFSCKESETSNNYKNPRNPAAATVETGSGADAGAKPAAGGETGEEQNVEGLSIAEQAQAILANNCARCHGATNSQGNFAIIDNVPAMLASGRYIVPGNPEGSLIFSKLAPFGNMPPAGPLRSEDVNIIKQWIQGLQSNQVAPLRDTQVLDLIQKDIQNNVAVADQVQVRYFSLHVPNNVGTSETDLETMRKAFAKVVNSLSRSPVIIKPVAVDAKKLIYRVKLDEMGIPINVFESVMNDFYPYSQQYLNNVADATSIQASQNDSSLRTATGSSNYLIRADWFIATATLPVPYERLLQLGANQAALDQQLGINTLNNINGNRVLRAGFRNSGMSSQNRVIERHAQLNGLSYWTSYDFASNAGTGNVFNNPLGPQNLNLTKEFAHQGAGIMFQLANGMFGFRVVNNNGVVLDKAPTNTLTQSGAPTEFLAAMVNGVSCMGCHNAGLIHKKDEIRAFAQANVGDFSQVEFEKILAIYPEERVFKETLDRDNAFYFNALNQIGIDPKKADPVSQTFRIYNRALSRDDVREELGISTAVLDGLLVNEPFKSRWSSLRSGGAISREDLSALLAQAVEQARIEVNITVPNQGDFVVTTACMFANQVQMDNCVVLPQP